MIHNVLKFQGYRINHLGTGTYTARVLALNLAGGFLLFFTPGHGLLLATNVDQMDSWIHRINQLGTGTNTARVLDLHLAIFFIFPEAYHL